MVPHRTFTSLICKLSTMAFETCVTAALQLKETQWVHCLCSSSTTWTSSRENIVCFNLKHKRGKYVTWTLNQFLCSTVETRVQTDKDNISSINYWLLNYINQNGIVQCNFSVAPPERSRIFETIHSRLPVEWGKKGRSWRSVECQWWVMREWTHFSRLGDRVSRLAEEAAFLSSRFLCLSWFPNFSLFLRTLEDQRRGFTFLKSTLIIIHPHTHRRVQTVWFSSRVTCWLSS